MLEVLYGINRLVVKAMMIDTPPSSGSLLSRLPVRYYLFLSAAAGLVVYLFLVYWRLKQFPGPFLGRFPKLWLIKSAIRGDTFWDLDTLCRKYGKMRCQFVSKDVRAEPCNAR